MTANHRIAAEWGKYSLPLAEWAMTHMVNRTDACGAHTALELRGTIGRNDKKIEKIYTCKQPLTTNRLQRHFSEHAQPEHVIGVHTLSAENTCKVVSLDIDAHTGKDDQEAAEANKYFALAVFANLDRLGLRPLLWDSNGKGGFHIDVIFSRPIPGADAHRFGKWLVRNWKEYGFAKAPESFPKQAVAEPLGNWLRLIGRHHTRDIWATVYDPESSEWLSGEAAALAVLAHQPVTPDAIPHEAIAEPPDEKVRENPTTPIYRSTADDDIRTVCAALSVIPATDDYDHWIYVGSACHGVSESLLPEWEAWSRASSSYANGRYTCEEKWKTFGRKTGKVVGIGTLCLLADNATGRKSWRPERPVDPGVDISGILNRLNGQQHVKAAVAQGMKSEDLEPDEDNDDATSEPLTNSPFPQECLRPPGLIAEIIDYNLRTAIYPQPELAMVGALCLMSTITGRRVRDDFGTRTNIMTIALGPSRSGKEHSRQVNKKLLEMCRADQLFEEKCASHSALHGFLKTEGVGLLMNDEFGDFLALARSTRGQNTQPAQILSAMVKLYSSSAGKYKADRYADNTKQVEINQPHLVLYGSSTCEVFWKNVTPEYVSGGLFGRLMIFENRGYVDVNTDIKSLESNPPQPVIYDEMMGWLNCYGQDTRETGNLIELMKNPIPIVFQHTPEAKERYLHHMVAISKRRMTESPVPAVLWSGTAENTAKLALLFACSRDRFAQQIELQDVNLAVRLSNWLTRRKIELSQDNIAENAVESATKRVFRIIKESGSSGIPQNVLTRKTQWLSKRDREDILNGLVQATQICQVDVKTKTKTKLVWMAVAVFKSKA